MIRKRIFLLAKGRNAPYIIIANRELNQMIAIAILLIHATLFVATVAIHLAADDVNKK
jgi:hypothetical protein